MDEGVKKLISWWKLLGRQQHDHFMRFFIFYMCLDAWLTAGSGKDSDQDKLDWLINTDNDLKKHWAGIASGSQFQSWLNGLAKIGTVKDERPSQRRKPPVTLTDTSDFGQVIRFIYQIRCNLFHGSKSPVNPNDNVLVHLSSKILERWIEWASVKAL